jgi:glucose/arabinose dehydrogenase
MQNILPSGLVVYKAEVNLEKKKLENLKLIFKQKVFLVTGSNYGGALALSNDQRFLYVSVGDQGNYDTVQQTSSGVGKLLRFNLDGSIPKDNPFLVSKKPTEVYAYGFRNVYGIVQMPTDELLAIDHGPLGGDELNLVRKSGNYGWPISSEGVHYSGEYISSFVSKTIGPVLSWSDAVAPSAISVISKNKFSGLNGDVLVSTLKGKSIFRIHNYCRSKFKIVEKLSFDFRIRDFSVTESGQLIILSDTNPAKLSVFTMDR